MNQQVLQNEVQKNYLFEVFGGLEAKVLPRLLPRALPGTSWGQIYEKKVPKWRPNVMKKLCFSRFNWRPYVIGSFFEVGKVRGENLRWMPPRCLPDAFQMSLRCFPKSSRCLLSVFQMPFRCLSDVSQTSYTPIQESVWGLALGSFIVLRIHLDTSPPSPPQKR